MQDLRWGASCFLPLNSSWQFGHWTGIVVCDSRHDVTTKQRETIHESKIHESKGGTQQGTSCKESKQGEGNEQHRMTRTDRGSVQK